MSGWKMLQYSKVLQGMETVTVQENVTLYYGATGHRNCFRVR